MGPELPGGNDLWENKERKGGPYIDFGDVSDVSIRRDKQKGETEDRLSGGSFGDFIGAVVGGLFKGIDDLLEGK